MPILKPKKDESEKEYVARCIPDLMNKDPEKDQKQVIAICYSNFKKETVKEKMGSFKEKCKK